jgi:hypothetical protein
MAPLNEDTERRALLGVGALTVVSGAVQVAVPQKLLDALDVEDSPATRQLFGTVGMFMVIVGGLLVGALRRPAARREVLLGASLQKLGAAGAVAIGVRRSVFSPRALLVAGFDFASGLLALDYLRRLRRS